MQQRFDTDLLSSHGKALHALARALLRDEHAAADAVLDTLLVALARAPRHRASLGGWLHTVLRSFAWKRRRGDARRARRERQVARSEAVPATDELAARRELLHAVVEGVLSLDQPYRDAIWQRYFEELPPGVIAQRAGVPVATVKSRLQRGLARLRVLLDGHGKGDWRAGLALAFRIEDEAVVGVAPAAAVLWLSGASAAVAAALASWWMSGGDPPLPVPAGGTGRALAVAAAARDEVPATHGERRETVMAPDSGAAGALTFIRGRCVVAETAEPLPGCRVRLDGSWSLSHLREVYGDPAWEDPPIVETDPDGSFVLAFAPPRGFQFGLDIQAPGRVPRTARWDTTEIGPGQEFDFGSSARWATWRPSSSAG
jgi:RNA polymerase sigma-70 factor (ECF subfamily)